MQQIITIKWGVLQTLEKDNLTTWAKMKHYPDMLHVIWEFFQTTETTEAILLDDKMYKWSTYLTESTLAKQNNIIQ